MQGKEIIKSIMMEYLINTQPLKLGKWKSLFSFLYVIKILKFLDGELSHFEYLEKDLF